MIAFADLIEVANQQDDNDFKDQILALFLDNGELSWVRKRYDFNGPWSIGDTDATNLMQK